jgi:hypothetical protein
MDYFDMADFLQKFDHFHQAANYFTTMKNVIVYMCSKSKK